jgi:hypothetical protein
VQIGNPTRDQNFRIKIMAASATFSAGSGLLSEFGDAANNSLITSRDGAGRILVNNGAVPIMGGTAAHSGGPPSNIQSSGVSSCSTDIGGDACEPIEARASGRQ